MAGAGLLVYCPPRCLGYLDSDGFDSFGYVHHQGYWRSCADTRPTMMDQGYPLGRGPLRDFLPGYNPLVVPTSSTVFELYYKDKNYSIQIQIHDIKYII